MADGEAPTVDSTSNGVSAVPQTNAPLWAADVAALVTEIAADISRFADPAVITRAASLSELAAAALMRDLRARKDDGVRAKDVDAFDMRLRKIRREREKEQLLAAAQQRRSERQPSWRDELVLGDNMRPSACFANACLMLEHIYRGRLSYDIMAERPCLDGDPVDDRAVSRIRRHLGSDEGVNYGKEDIAEAVSLVGSEAREFHPVRDYLRACRARWDGVRRLDNAATLLLKVPEGDRLARTMVRRTMIAMAARGLCPGVKVDTILILLGYQGAKKSTFFRTLGGPWFGDSKVDITDRKGQMVMAARWIYEWPEIDKVFQKHSDSDIKAFVSQQDDTYIPMYGRSVKTVERSWLAVGTTNKKRFLTDATGDRRAWVIDLHGNGSRWKVNAKLVEMMRDLLFGEAVAEYEAFLEAERSGVAGDENPHRWWLNDEEEAEREGRTSDFHVENVWAETVGKWLAGEKTRCLTCRGTKHHGDKLCGTCMGVGFVERSEKLPETTHGRRYVTSALVLEAALGVKPEQLCAHGTRIADTLSELGWAQGKRIRVGGRKVTPYYSPEHNPEADAAERDEEIERAAIQTEAGAPAPSP